MNYLDPASVAATEPVHRAPSFLGQLRPAIGLVVLFTLLTGIILPFGFEWFGQAVFPYQAGGSMIVRNGAVVGSALIGQNFAKDEYFHPRPSATVETDPNDSSKTVSVPYAADNSSGSNLAPTSKALVDRVSGDVAKLGAKPVPGDAVTTSASGLDPNISPEFARLQVARVAAARKLPPEQVQTLVDQNTSGRLIGLIGEPRVDVLGLNLALEAAKP